MSETQPTPSEQPAPAAEHPAPAHPDVRRERTDANVQAIVTFGLSLAGLLILIHFLLLWMFDALEHREKSEDPGRPAIARERPVFPRDLKDIPPPMLQRVEDVDLEDLRRQEDALLNGYQIQGSEVRRIPVAEAVRLLETNQQAAAAGGIRFRAAPPKEPKGGKK
jgi:hypothetical protein